MEFSKCRVERKRVRRARISITQSGEVIFVIPFFWLPNMAERLYEEKRGWIRRKIEMLRSATASMQTGENELLLFGEIYKMCEEHDDPMALPHPSSSSPVPPQQSLPGPGGGGVCSPEGWDLSLARIDEGKKCVYVSKRTGPSESKALLFEKLARSYLIRRTSILAARHGFALAGISIRNQVSRWGSCSFRNGISLNRKLLRCPVSVIDYVICHELAHTRIKNHSSHFWDELKRFHGDHAEPKEWLRLNGAAFIRP